MIDMKVTFLGTGVCIARAERSSPGLLVEIGNEKLLFDCGSGSIKTLKNLGYDISNFNYLFLTHFHIDHVTDYPTIVKDRKFTTGEILNAYGPPGLKRHTDILFNQLFAYMGDPNDLNIFDFLKLKEVTEGVVEKTDNWTVSCAPVIHHDGVAYRVDSKGKSLAYSGDTAPCDSLVELGKNVDVAILECSYSSKESLKGKHFVPETAAKAAQAMKAKKLILTHLYPETEGKEKDMVERAKQHFDGEVVIAEDLMKIEI